MVIYPRKKLHGFAAVPLDDGIIQDKHFDTFRPGKPAECIGHFCGKEQQKLRPVKRSFIQKTVISVLGNSLFFPFGIQEAEKIPALEYQQQQKLEYLICRNTAGFCDIGFLQQFSDLKLLDSVRKLILGIFILVHLVYHKISTSSFGMILMW